LVSKLAKCLRPVFHVTKIQVSASILLPMLMFDFGCDAGLWLRCRAEAQVWQGNLE
jgi:hypothetical protein